ncbi:MAG TPA: lactonase family protein, partial [Kofleriaceae bacterium]
VDSGGNGPAHIAVDGSGTLVLVANYGGGSVATFPIRADGGLDAARQTLSPGTNAHMILTDAGNRHAFVPCKGSDYIAQYNLDPATGMLTANAVPRAATLAGAGPRHLAFAPGGAHAYLVNENDSTLTVFAYDATTGQLSAQQTVSTRAAGATGSNTGAEIAVHPSGTWVYASNRGDNTIATFRIDQTGKVALVGQTPTGGATPRQFAIDPTGGWLFVANQDSNTVVRFAIDVAAGTLTRTGTPLTASQPSFIGFAALPAR